MKLIVGLGNPGIRYRYTRHNIGFLIVKQFAKKNRLRINKRRFSSLICQTHINNEKVILALPLTFMNVSGEAVSLILNNYKVDLKDMLVICDDVNLPLGIVRIRSSGSAGGHNGLKSIIEAVSSFDFPRLRIGITGETLKKDLVRFVLSPFAATERQVVKKTIEKATAACEAWLKDGIEKTMNLFN